MNARTKDVVAKAGAAAAARKVAAREARAARIAAIGRGEEVPVTSRTKSKKGAGLSAAQKAWATRRANGDASAAANKAWETRRANAKAATKTKRTRRAA